MRTIVVLGFVSCLVGCRGAGSAADETTSDTSGSSTSGGTESGSGSSSESGDGGPQNECDLCEQDCPDGQRCVPVSASPDLVPDYLSCEPIPEDPKDPGERCKVEDYYGAGKDDCGEGAFCVLDSLEDMTGFCQPTCCFDEPEPGCEPQDVCEAFFTGYEHVPPVSLCMPACDPLSPISCDEAGRVGWTCIPTAFDASCEFLCVPPTQVPDADQLGDQGDACLLWSDCKEGLHCRPAPVVGCTGGEDGWCCTAYCDPAGPDTCPDDLSCEPFDCADPTIPEAGACILPGG
jgi:hypothetical protein